MEQPGNKENRKKKKSRFPYRIVIPAAGIAVAVILVAIVGLGSRPAKEEVPDGYFSEEQAAARLATLEAAQSEKTVEVVPMKFFTEEIRPDEGSFTLTAVTTMPEDVIADVSFLVVSEKDPEQEAWYDGEKTGNGYYRIHGSAADLGHTDGTYTIKAYITPDGGDETEAGEAEIEMELTDYFYSEALGEGRQSLVLVHPSTVAPEEPEDTEEPEGDSDSAAAGTENAAGSGPAETESTSGSETAGADAEDKAEAGEKADSTTDAEDKAEAGEKADSAADAEDKAEAGEKADSTADTVDTAEAGEKEEDKQPEFSGVVFKVWTVEDGQEDLTEYEAKEKGKNIWYAEISLDDFSNKGNFIANAYAVYEEKEVGIASAGFELLPDPFEVPQGKGHVVRQGKRVYVEVPEIMQNPELPTGCESVALTIVLNSMGYKLGKTEIAKDWLPRGDNLATSYVGDPFSPYGAGCFPPAIAATATEFLSKNGDSRRGHNITGASINELCDYIDKGTPVIMWSSSYMAYPAHTGNIVTFRGQTYEWYSSEHCLVLYGYDREKQVYLVSDPLAGLVERDMDAFEKIYNEIGKYAVVIY